MSVTVISACHQAPPDGEEEACRMLDEARQLMNRQEYGAARDSVLVMRKRFPMAFKARTAGIVVMDSIELLEAQDSLAIIDGMLQKEQALLEEMEAEKSRKDYDERTQQKVKVFGLRQYLDEMGAKVKFYLRKIEIDKNRKDAE